MENSLDTWDNPGLPRKISGLLVLKLCIKVYIDVNKCREWVVDRSQNMGPNCLEFLVIFLTSVTVQKVGCCLCGNVVLKCMFDMEKGREWAA